MYRLVLLAASLGLVAILAAACSSEQDGAALTVEAYLDALSAKDMDRVVNLSCAEWETDAVTEVDSLEAVTVRLENVSCAVSGTEDDYTLVDCTGNLIMSYNGEDRPLDLSRRTYRAVQNSGTWLVCGYQE